MLGKLVKYQSTGSLFGRVMVQRPRSSTPTREDCLNLDLNFDHLLVSLFRISPKKRPLNAGYRMESHWAGAQSTIDEELAHLQAVFIKQTRDLSQRRNELTPVYRLPPELLSRIFFATLSQNQEKKHHSRLNPAARIQNLNGRVYNIGSYEFSSRPQTRKLDVLPLCHVSQCLRTVALNSPELWNHIQVDLRTKPELLDFMKTNAKGLPLTLDLDADNGYPPWSHFRSRLILSEILGSGAGRLKSLAFCCSKGDPAHNRVVADLMAANWSSSPAQQLQALEVTVFQDEEEE